VHKGSDRRALWMPSVPVFNSLRRRVSDSVALDSALRRREFDRTEAESHAERRQRYNRAVGFELHREAVSCLASLRLWWAERKP
jgi:hypothetical protein